jgi:hypothetical protein
MNSHFLVRITFAVLVSCTAVAVTANGVEPFTIDADFPGGNIIVDDVTGDDVFLHQDLRDTAGYWFYWHFRVRGAAGRTVSFHFTNSDRKIPIGVRGPAVSDDGGKTWRWLGAEAVRGPTFRYAFPKDAGDVRFCFAFPYQEANLLALVERHKASPHLRVETLCRTKKGRDVELLFAGRLDGRAEHKVALTCRHHSCEMMASYALEGLLDEVLAGTDAGPWLREHVEFFIVPMVDKDGVENGDQGKNRKPRDHNRDYDGTSIHASVAAIREKLPAWSQGKLDFALDMHCPAASGAGHEIVYFVAGPDAKIWGEAEKFCRTLEQTQTGPIRYRTRNNLPYGQGWNTAANFTAGKAFSRWAAELPGTRAATTIEIAYANAEGDTVTDQSARALGRDLARAFRKYLAE